MAMGYDYFSPQMYGHMNQSQQSLMDKVKEFFLGKKEKFEQLPTMTGQQMSLFNQLLGGLGGANQAGMGFLQDILGGDTSKFEAPLMREYSEKIVPGLAERFSGAGAGAQSSSAFQQALSGSAADLTERLGALRGGLQMQGLGQLSNLLNQGLGQRSFENIFRPASKGFLQSSSEQAGELMMKLLPLLIGA